MKYNITFWAKREAPGEPMRFHAEATPVAGEDPSLESEAENLEELFFDIEYKLLMYGR